MPGYGITTSDEGLLPWEWARQRLESAHNYWLATADRDGTPHLTVVWGVWHEDAFLFSTGLRSRKARDLTSRPQCSVAPEAGAESVVVQGVATLVGNPHGVAELYRAKYGEGFPDPLWRVQPHTVIAVREAAFTTAATRWTFDD
jgi:Pyridoxamine 5'-phosphate oxidase